MILAYQDSRPCAVARLPLPTRVLSPLAAPLFVPDAVHRPLSDFVGVPDCDGHLRASVAIARDAGSQWIASASTTWPRILLRVRRVRIRTEAKSESKQRIFAVLMKSRCISKHRGKAASSSRMRCVVIVSRPLTMSLACSNRYISPHY